MDLYHRLDRTPQHRWWRAPAAAALVVVLALALQLVLFLGFAAAGAIAGRPDGPEGVPSLGPLADLALTFLSVAVLLPAVWLAVLCLQHRRPGTLSSVAGRLRGRLLARALPLAGASAVLSLVAGVGLSVATGAPSGVEGTFAGWWDSARGVVVVLLVVPVQAAAEEYAFRGWLLQALGAYARRPWLPIAVQALLFAALHGWGTPWGFADLVVFGVLTGWLTVRTGGLEAAIALHVANNVLAGLLAVGTGQLTVDGTAADAPWQVVVVDVLVVAVYTLVVARLSPPGAPAAVPSVTLAPVAAGMR
ncbi:type II CAAX endopeptidase family protein [Actinoplanes sp. NPDC049548]|uniref:CPBP family intramembrane glutamic endopeptidase n=1 Tax=Actinoplanes sp. NPDC049548 TaxID=3155152 RepID=UPI00342B0B95